MNSSEVTGNIIGDSFVFLGKPQTHKHVNNIV